MFATYIRRTPTEPCVSSVVTVHLVRAVAVVLTGARGANVRYSGLTLVADGLCATVTHGFLVTPIPVTLPHNLTRCPVLATIFTANVILTVRAVVTRTTATSCLVLSPVVHVCLPATMSSILTRVWLAQMTQVCLTLCTDRCVGAQTRGVVSVATSVVSIHRVKPAKTTVRHLTSTSIVTCLVTAPIILAAVAVVSVIRADTVWGVRAVIDVERTRLVIARVGVTHVRHILFTVVAHVAGLAATFV